MTEHNYELTDPIYSELSTAEKVDRMYDVFTTLERKLDAVWQEVAPLLADIMPMVEAIQESSGFKMLVGRRAATKLKEGRGK